MQERHPEIGLTRRRLSIGLCLGLVTTLAGCGGTSEDAPLSSPASNTNPVPASTTAWDIAPNRALSLPAGATFDLAATLPSAVRVGGSFDVDPSGAPLPAGISLQPNGLLSVSANATGGTAGVVFRYTPPA